MSVDALLGLSATGTPDRFVVRVHPGVVTGAGALQGGAALGAAVTAMARATQRPLIWATGHFLRHAAADAVLDLQIESPMRGHRVTQARARLASGEEEILHVVGALGERDLGVEHTWARPPDVPPPQRCPPRSEVALGAWEIRRARGREPGELDGVPGPGRSGSWYRRPGGRGPITPAELAIVGDCGAAEVSDAVGFFARCNSLDNTLRVAEGGSSEWILLDAHIHHLSRGFAATQANLWSEEGRLLAVFSQTLVVRRTDPDGEAIRTTKHFASRTGPRGR